MQVFAQLQDLKVAHRDIKPANIFLHATIDFKIADFGASRMFNEQTAKQTRAIGTLLFMGYEIAQAFSTGFFQDLIAYAYL